MDFIAVVYMIIGIDNEISCVFWGGHAPVSVLLHMVHFKITQKSRQNHAKITPIHIITLHQATTP